MIRRPSRSTRTTPPFPDQTLFRARSILARIVARDLDGDGIDVAGQHIAMRKLGDGNRKLACSGADIESIDMHTRSDEFGNEFETAGCRFVVARSEEHTSELQSLMRISYAVFCLKKTTKQT